MEGPYTEIVIKLKEPMDLDFVSELQIALSNLMSEIGIDSLIEDIDAH